METVLKWLVGRGPQASFTLTYGETSEVGDEDAGRSTTCSWTASAEVLSKPIVEPETGPRRGGLGRDSRSRDYAYSASGRRKDASGLAAPGTTDIGELRCARSSSNFAIDLRRTDISTAKASAPPTLGRRTAGTR